MGGILDIPIIGDVVGTGLEILGAGSLQNDAQAHSAQMFTEQVKHDKDMFGLESAYSSAQAQKAYQRQRSLLQDSPGLQMKGLKSAGLNPILAATGGFKSPAGGSMPIPRAATHSSARGDSTSSPSISKVQLGQARLLNEQAKLTSAQKAKVDAERTRIQSEQPKKDFWMFFWKVYNGTLQKFDEAFNKWANSNREWLDNWMDEHGLSIKSIKEDFRKYVTDAPPGKNPISGGYGRKQRRNK